MFASVPHFLNMWRVLREKHTNTFERTLPILSVLIYNALHLPLETLKMVMQELVIIYIF